MKVLLIGAGKGGSALLSILHEDKEIEIVGVVDNNPQAEGLKIARQYNIPIYTHYEKLIKGMTLTLLSMLQEIPRYTLISQKINPQTPKSSGFKRQTYVEYGRGEKKRMKRKFKKSLRTEGALSYWNYAFLRN